MNVLRYVHCLGCICSCMSMIFLLSACADSRWMHDTLNAVDMGLWTLSNMGVKYKLANAGINVNDPDEASRMSYYSRYCAFSTLTQNDLWCQQDASTTRGLVVVALLAAIISCILGIMSVSNTKMPTWNGEGRDATLVIPILCSLLQSICLCAVFPLWFRMTNVYDTQCKERNKIVSFACAATGHAFTLMATAIPFAMITFWCWRFIHSHRDAVKRGKIADYLTLAVKTDDVDAVLTAISNGAKVDALGSDGRNALHWACTLGRSTACHVLLKHGALLTTPDDSGWTALHWASRVGNSDIVRLLAKHGARINVTDRWGTTPLMLTIAGQNRQAAETLLELGADVNARNIYGQTSLMLCAESTAELFQLGMILINSGSDLALQDAQAQTALHYAISVENLNLLASMLHLCDIDIVEKPNKYGETLFDFADLRMKSRASKLLESWQEGNELVLSGRRQLEQIDEASDSDLSEESDG